jgi:hypothetical protein
MDVGNTLLLTKVYLEFVEQIRQNASAKLNTPDNPLFSHQSRIRAQKPLFAGKSGNGEGLIDALVATFNSSALLGAPLYGNGFLHCFQATLLNYENPQAAL